MVNSNNTDYLSLEGLRNADNTTTNQNIIDASAMDIVSDSLKESAAMIGEGDLGVLDVLRPIERGSLNLENIQGLVSDMNPDMPESSKLIAGFKSKYGLAKGAFQTGFIPILAFFATTIGLAILVYRQYKIKTESPFNRRQFFEIIIGALLIIFFYGFVRSILLGFPLMIKESLLLAGLYIIGYMGTYGLMYRTYKDKNQVMH
jgi:hypothetical protein